MVFYGETSAVVAAAMGFLAEHDGTGSVSLARIACARNLSPAHLAKVPTRLVRGVTGPRGGCRPAGSTCRAIASMEPEAFVR